MVTIFSCLGIYGVGKAALYPPALAILSHRPEGATKTIAWVGKGIVYDTGGLSIKDKVDILVHNFRSQPVLHALISLVYHIGNLCCEKPQQTPT